MTERCERSISPGQVLVFAYGSDGISVRRGILSDGKQAFGRQSAIEINADPVDAEITKGELGLCAHDPDGWQLVVHRHLNDAGSLTQDYGGIGPINVYEFGSHIDRRPSVMAVQLDLDVQVQVDASGQLVNTDALPQTEQADLPNSGCVGPESEQDGETLHFLPPRDSSHE